MPETLTGWAGWLVAAVATLVAAMTQIRKVRVDESTVALQMWEGLAKAHTTEIQALTKRLTAAEEQIAEMRRENAKALAEQEQRHDKEIRALHDENAGLKRLIAQNSQSTAQRLGDPGGTAITQAARQERGET